MDIMQIVGWDNATLPAPLARGRTRRAVVHHFSPPPDNDPVCRWRYKRATQWTPPEVSTLSGRVHRRTPLTLPSGELLFSQTVRVRSGRCVTLRQEMGSRARRASLLAARLRAAATREAVLGQDLHAFARSGYRLFALNLASGEETSLGFIPAEGPLTLTGVELEDGDYEIRVRADGCYWRDARYAKVFPLSVAGGEMVAPLPAVTGLTYARLSAGQAGGTASLMVSWNWLAGGGTQAPEDFALWISPIQPVDTSGAPDETVAAPAPGGYSVTIPDEAEAFFVAVCARRGLRTGPLATIPLPAPETDIASPDNQAAWFAPS